MTHLRPLSLSFNIPSDGEFDGPQWGEGGRSTAPDRSTAQPIPWAARCFHSGMLRGHRNLTS